MAGYNPEDVWSRGKLHGKSLAFVELVDFSDCEGTIGPATSAKLARDFAQYRDKASECDDGYFLEKYAEWQNAFELASNNGAVCFH